MNEKSTSSILRFCFFRGWSFLMSSGRSGFAIFIACLVVGVMYAPGFNGFWHGDDFPNLHRVYAQSQQGSLWSDTFLLFSEPVPSLGAFYRPMMMLSLALNYVIGDAVYANWYGVNFFVHVLNTLLIALVVRRLAKSCNCDPKLSAPLAAVFFGLCPSVAEGVYWVSARSDGWVTLFSLCGIYFWAGNKSSSFLGSAYLLPLLLIVALGFKESAAVLPLQMLLLAVAWNGPLSRDQRLAIAAAFLVVFFFLVWRTYLFGNAWQVYAENAVGIPLYVKLWNALRSLGPWWTALGQATPVLSQVYLVCCLVGLMLLAFPRPMPQWRLTLALLGASGGLVLATLLNVGALSSTGEGGRLSYGPVAWLGLVVGVLMSPARPLTKAQYWRFFTAFVVFSVALLTGGGVLWSHLDKVWQAQARMQFITRSIPMWAETHQGITMLMVPDNDGVVVMARNAQAGIVLEPVQKQAYLHRVVPTLSSEVQMRQEQFCRGMAQRLQVVRPRFANSETLAAIVVPAGTVWPNHVACWSKSQQKFVSLRIPPIDASCHAWMTSIRSDIENCQL